MIHPELQSSRPTTKYNIHPVVPWVHIDDRKGYLDGHTIYKYVQKYGTLASCLGYGDLLAIKVIGIAVFRQLFLDREIYGWKTTVETHDGRYVPVLRAGDGKLMLYWSWLGNAWNSHDLAVVSPSGTLGLGGTIFLPF